MIPCGDSVSRYKSIYSKELRQSTCKRPLWYLGFDIGSVFSNGYLLIIILAPLGAVNLVFNVLFAKLLLDDMSTKQTVVFDKNYHETASTVDVNQILPETVI